MSCSPPPRNAPASCPSSPMLREPFTALCTPIRSPAADSALLRLHLAAWIFRTSANDSTCPPPGVPLRIVRTSAGPRLDFSEAVRPGPFGHWRCSIGRMNWPMRRAPDALRRRLLRHVRQPLLASFFPAVLPDIASRAAQLLEALAALFPPGTLSALRRLREANIHALAAMAPPDPEAARRRAQFMRAHPAHAALILHSYHPDHRGSGPCSFVPTPIPSLGKTLEWIDRNRDPGQIIRGLTGARTILPTSRPLRRSRANLVAELDILHLCSASPRCIPQRLRALPGNIWFCGGSSPYADHLPDNHFAAAAAEAWAQDPRLRDERIRSPPSAPGPALPRRLPRPPARSTSGIPTPIAPQCRLPESNRVPSASHPDSIAGRRRPRRAGGGSPASSGRRGRLDLRLPRAPDRPGAFPGHPPRLPRPHRARESRCFRRFRRILLAACALRRTRQPTEGSLPARSPRPPSPARRAQPLDKELASAMTRPCADQWHSDKDLLRSDKRNPCFGRLPEAGGLILGSVQISGGGSPEPFGPWLL